MADFGTRLLVFDTESTGLDTDNDRVVELAAVYFEGRAYDSHRQMLIDPERPIPKEASDVHKITDDAVRGKPTFAAVADAFARHLDGRARDGVPPVLVGYNAVGYDVPLLNAEFDRAGHPARIDPRSVVDPMIFVRYALRSLRQRSLTAVAEHLGIRLENAHRASADARATGEVLLAFVARGLMPDDVDETLAVQHRLTDLLDEEFARFSYWLYADRDDGGLRLGAGKHCGSRLDEVDPGYFDYLLRTIPDLPDAVRAELSARARR